MAKFQAFTRGTQLVLVAGPLLFLSLFLTWQDVTVDYGRAGTAKVPLDGWDAWGALLALLVAATVVLVVIRQSTDAEWAGGLSRATVTLALGLAVAAAAVLKNLTDAGSTIASYVFVALACVVAAGTYLDWAAERRGERPPHPGKRRGLSGVA